MKTVLTGSLVLFLGIAAMAQETFTFDYIEERMDESEIVEEDVRKHYLGNAIAKKMLLANNSYVFYEEVTPKNPLPTRQVDKYAIYTSLKKLNTFYKKAIKSGTYTKDEAFKRFNRVLTIVLCVRYQNTIDLEAALLKVKAPAALDKFFADNIVLDGLYEEAVTRVE